MKNMLYKWDSLKGLLFILSVFFFIDDGSNQWHEHKRGWLFECTITYRLLYSDNVDILVTIFLFGGGGSSLDLPIPACNIFFCICHSQGWGK